MYDVIIHIPLNSKNSLFHLPVKKTQISSMCFSLFKSKSKNSDVQSKRSSTRSNTPVKVSSSSRSRTNSRSNEFNTFNDSKSSSISSKASLSSLKDSLPENPHIYDFTEIRSATKNFLSKPISSSSSSSSASWKCVIDKKQSMITQRKLRRPIDDSELRKMLSLLCKSHHASLVKLHGASVSGNYIYLVYEFISGANLSDCLRNPRNPNFTVLSSWISRVQIVAGIADGLDYMHNCSGFKNGFIHNHIKSSSIIICEEPALVAKICHFGTAQLCGEFPEAVNEIDEKGKDNPVLKRPSGGEGKFVGTRGYMSPEFQTTGIPTLKADIYSFGVVILELLSGEEPLKVKADSERGVFRKVSLIETAREAIESGKLRQWVDRRLRDSYPVEVAERLTQVALDCVMEDPSKRPDMGRVAAWISKLYLDSKTWAQSIGLPDEITVSLAPR